MAKDKSWLLLVVIGVFVAYFLNLGGLYDTICGNYNVCLGAASTAPAGQPTPGTQDLCIYDGATMTIGPMQERWNPGTVVSDLGVRVFVNGVDRGVKADESTMDVNYGDEIVLYYAENETEGSIGHYTAKQAFTVPCTSAFSSADKGDADELFAFEASGNALGFKVFCEDDGLLNVIGTSEDINSGDVVSLDFSLQPTFEDAWSPYCKGIVVLDGNGTTYDDIIVNGWEDAPVPTQHRTNATHYEEYAYYVPALTSSNGAYTSVKGTITLDAASVTIGAHGTINVTWYDCDFYRHSNTGEMMQGVENDAGSDIGGTNYQDVIYIA